MILGIIVFFNYITRHGLNSCSLNDLGAFCFSLNILRVLHVQFRRRGFSLHSVSHLVASAQLNSLGIDKSGSFSK